MQLSTLLLVAGAPVASYVFYVGAVWRSNIAKAKASGLPYVVSPCQPYTIVWQLTHKFLSPGIRLLPSAWWESWLDVVTPNYTYRSPHDYLEKRGDAFVIVSPGHVYVYLANAEGIHQVTTKRDAFVKWTETYDILRIFGDNVLCSEGAIWRMHRKVTSASFNERNANLVFHEAIRQTQGLIRFWERGRNAEAQGAQNKGTDDGSGPGPVMRHIEHDTMRLALNIIGFVGFGLQLPWPGEAQPKEISPRLAKYASLHAPEGHSLSFVDTIATVLENIILLLVMPVWLLQLLPFKATRTAATAYHDYVKYMDELLDEKIQEARQGNKAEVGMDLMGQLARSSFGANPASTNTDIKHTGTGPTPKSALSRSDIVGNAFIMLVAGHETTANALHFTIVQLAANPSAQRHLQRDIDKLLESQPEDPAQWDFDGLINPMMASMLGASMNETLRTLPPVTDIPKVAVRDETISIEGREYLIPAGAVISLSSIAVQRNPKHWPTRESVISPGQNDMRDWVPERWYRTSESSAAEEASANDSDDSSSGKPQTLFRPRPSAFIPFSEGPRACLGRRIAQVEIVAALALLFRTHSVELAVHDDVVALDDTDHVIDEVSRKRQAYAAAQSKCRRTIADAGSVLTLKLLDGAHVPLRLVKRGEEQYVNWVD